MNWLHSLLPANDTNSSVKACNAQATATQTQVTKLLPKNGLHSYMHRQAFKVRKRPARGVQPFLRGHKNLVQHTVGCPQCNAHTTCCYPYTAARQGRACWQHLPPPATQGGHAACTQKQTIRLMMIQRNNTGANDEHTWGTSGAPAPHTHSAIPSRPRTRPCPHPVVPYNQHTAGSSPWSFTPGARGMPPSRG